MIENFTYEMFVQYNEKWLQNTRKTWLITGHLAPEDARKIIEIADITP